MPVYNYQCVYCGEKEEKLVKINDQPPFCKTCGKPMKQIWSIPAVSQWKCSRGSL